MRILTHLGVVLYMLALTDSIPSPTDIETFRIDVLNLIDTFGNADDPPEAKPLIGSILRLVFHDCAGPVNPGTTAATNDNSRRLCDGCIDLDKGDHGGLQELAVAPIESICAKYASLMNRADCWATTGNVALEYSVHLAPEADTLPALPYFFGRTQCQLSPNAITGDDPGTEFPLAHLGWDPLMSFFKTFFNFNLREATVIMGAHTVGRAHSDASGFEGKWTHDTFAFNNAFYQNLVDTRQQWDQTSPLPTHGFPQWTNMGRDSTVGGEDLMMLNADMSLVMAMEHAGSDGLPNINEDTGVVRCRWREFVLSAAETCDVEDSLGIVEEYARDNQRFLDDFAAAWIKVVTLNQPDLLRVEVEAFRDSRDETAVTAVTPSPSSPPVLIQMETPSELCCVAKRVPNWNGRCWGATTQEACDAVQPPGKRCEWRPSECRATQTCKLRDVGCESNGECCSERCRPDTKQCR